ncbi:MAG: hypothetical protein LBG64_01275 [Pseudomonadales bacterium]|nr:hypothetical protein [Pseudomonadales bacterium]
MTGVKIFTAVCVFLIVVIAMKMFQEHGLSRREWKNDFDGFFLMGTLLGVALLFGVFPIANYYAPNLTGLVFFGGLFALFVAFALKSALALVRSRVSKSGTMSESVSMWADGRILVASLMIAPILTIPIITFLNYI